MYNTIILWHGDIMLSKMEMKKFEKGDTVISGWPIATEVKRWNISDKDEAGSEITKKKNTKTQNKTK